MSLGASVSGRLWDRPDDTFGLALARDNASNAARRFFAAGGLSILVGDGKLFRSGAELILETYYSFAVFGSAKASIDYQYVNNPAYNRDRGPVSVFGVRVHAEFWAAAKPVDTREFAIRLGTALLLGAIIGFERQWRQRMAGLRTKALVSIGAAGFVVFDTVSGDDSPTRVAAQIVSGIGFLGAGVILQEGINTAATLWCSVMIETFTDNSRT